MLDAQGLEYTYREYTKEPLNEAELRSVLAKLGLSASEVLRRHDRAYKELALTGKETDDTLIAEMVKHPTLLQRPIGILGEHAIVGRPAERLLELING